MFSYDFILLQESKIICKQLYGKYGFRPCDFITKKIDKDRLKVYENNQKIVKIAKVKHVEKTLKYFISKYNNNYFDDKQIDHMVDKYRDELLSDFLKGFLKQYDDTCLIFSKMYKNIMERLGIVSFRGDTFVLLL